MPHARRPIRLFHSLAFAALGAMLTAAPPARSNDRPFQSVRTAVMEEEAQVWSVESWIERRGRLRSIAIEPEYIFTPNFSVQFELARQLDRDAGDSGHEGEIELKYLFNNVAKDGWGIGVSTTFATEHTQDSGRGVPSFSFKLPLSVSLGEERGMVHVNAGWTKPSNGATQWIASAAIEHPLTPQTTLFAELAREGGQQYGEAGVRHWLQRDKLAIDFAWQQQRSGGLRGAGLIVGVGWYDL